MPLKHALKSDALGGCVVRLMDAPALLTKMVYNNMFEKQFSSSNQGVGDGAVAPEQFIFAEAGAGARILIRVELESEQSYCRIAPSSRSSHFPINVFNLSEQCELLPHYVKLLNPCKLRLAVPFFELKMNCRGTEIVCGRKARVRLLLDVY